MAQYIQRLLNKKKKALSALFPFRDGTTAAHIVTRADIGPCKASP